MTSVVFSVILLLLQVSASSAKSGCENDVKSRVKQTFLAAVVEYEPVTFTNNGMSPNEYMMQNVQEYKTFVHEAKQLGVDIVVFPEYGLTSTIPVQDTSMDMSTFVEFAQEVPTDFPEGTCQTDPNYWSVLESISCMAQENFVYVVINLITRDQECDCFYNTQVAFDRQGQIVAKYHKYNLYSELHISRPPSPTPVSFTTDFGITVGLFICFDINYPHPSQDLVSQRVDVIAYSTAWVDEVPFLTAPQYHSGWALANDVTVLAAGYHDPQAGSLGSGIYDGRAGILNATYSSESGSQLVIGQLATTPGTAQVRQDTHHPYLHEDVSKYSKIALSPGDKCIHLNHTGAEEGSGSVYCSLSYSVVEPVESYHLIAYSGQRTFAGGQFTAGIQVCGLLLCQNGSCFTPNASSDTSTFDIIKLSGTFKPGLKAMPVHLDTNLRPYRSDYYSYNPSVIQSKHPIKNLYSLALYARNYQIDV